jgi:DNA-binding MarR family transcriptional regulator
MCNIEDQHCICNTRGVTISGVGQRTWESVPPSDRFSWLAFRKAAVELIAVLDADLQQHQEIGFTDFDALIHLLNAPDRTMRMADLARAVSRSPSALTRMVGRLEARHLVTRNRQKATEVTVTLSPEGLALIDEAAPRHLALVDQLFWSPLTPPQRTQLGTLCQRLIDAGCDAPRALRAESQGDSNC